VKVYLDGRRLKLTYVERGGLQARQVNAETPADLPRGRSHLGVEIAGQRSNVMELEIV
jgi:hypothetical protein